MGGHNEKVPTLQFNDKNYCLSQSKKFHPCLYEFICITFQRQSISTPDSCKKI